MKKIVIAAAAGGAAFALHRLAPAAREMHHQCREMMRDHCGETTSDGGPSRGHCAGAKP